jgi:hypothetical protein
LLAEEADWGSFVADPHAGEQACDRFLKVASLAYGRRLFTDICARGLTQVGAEGRTTVARGASELAEFWRITYTQLRHAMLNTRTLSPAELDACLDLLNDPNFVFMSMTSMAVWGRRPPE